MGQNTIEPANHRLKSVVARLCWRCSLCPKKYISSSLFRSFNHYKVIIVVIFVVSLFYRLFIKFARVRVCVPSWQYYIYCVFLFGLAFFMCFFASNVFLLHHLFLMKKKFVRVIEMSFVAPHTHISIDVHELKIVVFPLYRHRHSNKLASVQHDRCDLLWTCN